MIDTPGYQKMNEQERRYLQQQVARKWKQVLQMLAITFSLPVIAAAAIAFFQLRMGVDRTWHEWLVYFEINQLIWIPVYIIITLANLVYFLLVIPAILADLTRNVKKKVVFYPEPYKMETTGQYFIKTGLPKFLFFEVDYSIYSQIDSSESMTLEILPATKIFLDLKAGPDDVSVPNDHSI